VNALIGAAITESTAYGPGTEVAVAYAHEDQAAAVKALLERENAGAVPDRDASHGQLRRQVLLDLPDIDSRYAKHIELTRRFAAAHALSGVDPEHREVRRPAAAEAPRAVAEGNDPVNFVFCLNKTEK